MMYDLTLSVVMPALGITALAVVYLASKDPVRHGRAGGAGC
jgi:hypothetical protein